MLTFGERTPRISAFRAHSESMGFISEFRYPSRWYSTLVIAILGLLLFAFLAVLALSGFLTYRMVTPAQSHSEMNLKSFPGHPETLAYSVPGEGPRDGWFFPGLKSAPAVILCPAYQSSRGEVLTLAAALQDHQYNVFLFDFSAHGSSDGRTTLGFQEVAELRAAMDAVANRGDVDAQRFGVWGVNLGAYVAIAEAEGDPRVRALAADSPYNRPEELVGMLVMRSGLGSLPLVKRLTVWMFRLLQYRYWKMPPLQRHIANLNGIAQVYFEPADDPALAATTSELFRNAPPRRELVVLSRGNYAGMLDDEKHAYENRIVTFFLTNLAPLQSSAQGR